MHCLPLGSTRQIWGQGLHDQLALEARWPMEVPTTHIDYGKEPEARKLLAW